MAALIAASRTYGQDMSITYTFTDVDDGDTFNVGKGKVTLNYQMIGNPATQTDAGASIEYVSSTGVVTVRPGVDNLGGILRVFPR